MPVKINGATSGSVTLAAPATGSDVTLTLPAAAGTVATTAYADTVSGLVHINTTTFSASSGVSLNSVFSSTYDNYLLIINLIGSTGANLNFRLRAAGSDATSANYFWQGLYVSGTTPSGDRSVTQTLTRLGEHNASNSIYQVLIANPFTVAETRTRGYNAPYQTVYDISGGFTLTTSFDGFSLLPSAGTITGTLRVYGYKNGA